MMEKPIKIFIDDWRQPSSKHKTDGWILCASYQDFSDTLDAILEKQDGWIEEISFDYDIADYQYTGADCFKLLAQKIRQYGLPVPEKIYVHSEYPEAEKRFKPVAMALSNDLDCNVWFYKIGLMGGYRIINPFE